MTREFTLQVSTRSSKTDLSVTVRIPGTTIGAAPFFQGTAILHVMTNAIRVLEPGAPFALDPSILVIATWSETQSVHLLIAV